MATVRVWIVNLTVRLTLSICLSVQSYGTYCQQRGKRYNSIRTGRQVVRWNVLHTFEIEGYPISEDLETNSIAKSSLAREIRRDDVQGTSRVLQREASTSARKGFDVNPTRALSQDGNKMKEQGMARELEGDRGHFSKTCETFAEGEETGCSIFG
jgi:hypothetical protein